MAIACVDPVCVINCVGLGLVEIWALLKSFSLGDLSSLGQLRLFENPASFHNLNQEQQIQELQLVSMSQSSFGSEEQKSISAGSGQAFGVPSQSFPEHRARGTTQGGASCPRPRHLHSVSLGRPLPSASFRTSASGLLADWPPLFAPESCSPIIPVLAPSTVNSRPEVLGPCSPASHS